MTSPPPAPDKPSRPIRGLLARCLALVLIGCAAACIVNAAHPMGLPFRLDAVPSPGIPAWVWERVDNVASKQAHALWESESVVFLDVRDRDDYEEGHIPRSISLPYYEFSTEYPRIRHSLPRQGPLLIYCYGSHCGLSMRVAKRLLVMDYDNLIVLEGGIAAWQQAGYEVTTEGERRPADRGGAD